MSAIGLGRLLTRHKDRLRRMVAFRLDHRLQGRIDPSDVIQDVYVEVSQHLPEYQKQGSLPFFLWLRGVAGNKLRELHWHHLGTQMRDAGREVSLYPGAHAGNVFGGLGGPVAERDFWLGHGVPPVGPHLIEFNRGNKIVWMWEDHERAQMIHNMLVLE